MNKRYQFAVLAASLVVLPSILTAAPTAFAAIESSPGVDIREAARLEEIADITGALNLYQKALTMNGDNIVAGLGEARCYARLGLQNRAVQVLEKLCAEHKNDIRPWLNLAVIRLNAGELAPAAQAAAQALRLNQKSYAAVRILAEIAMRDQQYENAVQLCSELIEIEPTNRDGYLLMAQSCRRLSWSAADMYVVFEEASKNLPGDSELFNFFGQLARHRGSVLHSGSRAVLRNEWLALAEDSFFAAVQAAPDNVRYRLDLAKVMKMRGRRLAALQQAETILRQAPQNREAKVLCAGLQSANKDVAGRIKLWLQGQNAR